MRFAFDTNILLHYIRENEVFKMVENVIAPFSGGHDVFISVVSVGEIKSIARQNNWGEKKLHKMMNMLSKLIRTDINVESIIEAYAEIDAYSQNKLSHRPLPLTARNMGKNDLWIAATASVLDATLLTNDPDFDHLNGVFLPVAKISA